MKKIFCAVLIAATFLHSCKDDAPKGEAIVSYFSEKEAEGYRFGDQIVLPAEMLGDRKLTLLDANGKTLPASITPEHYTLGENIITLQLTNASGENETQDVSIMVLAKNAPKNISHSIIKEYPHDPKNFVQGFQLEGNTIYESDGQNGASQLLKYPLGSTTPLAKSTQSPEIFSEGCTIIGNKIFQLTWRNKKGFIYDKNTLAQIGEFTYPNEIGEGWGLTYDGTHLILSDGSSKLYFLNPENPSEIVRTIGVADHQKGYSQLNELEYHNGKIYANVWRENIILEINPQDGNVTGILDLNSIGQKHTKGADDVLNGITFKGNNMLITGKYWPVIYEISLQ